jgi:hypothetical protein
MALNAISLLDHMILACSKKPPGKVPQKETDKDPK